MSDPLALLDDPRRGLSRGAAWALALTATLTMAVSYFDRQALAVLAPTITQQLAISEQQYSWVISAFSCAYLVGAPLAGRLIDSVGARRGLLGAVLVWSAVAALHALMPGFAALFALRIALGLSEAPSFPGAAQTVQRALPPAERARGFGVLFTGSSLGAMLAPLIAIRLDQRWGFRVALLGTAVIGLLWVPLWLTVAFTPAARAVLDHAPPADRPASVLELLRHAAVQRAIAAVVATAPMVALLLNWGAKYLVRDHGLTQVEVGSYLWFPPVLLDIGAVTFGSLASRRATRVRSTQEGAPSGVVDGSPPLALFAMAATLSTLGAAIPLSAGPKSAVLLVGLCLAGTGGVFALLSADLLARVHPSAVSTAGGITAAAQSLAYIVAGPIIGLSVDRTHSYTAILVALGAWVIPGTALWLLWTPPPPYDAGKVTA